LPLAICCRSGTSLDEIWSLQSFDPSHCICRFLIRLRGSNRRCFGKARRSLPSHLLDKSADREIHLSSAVTRRKGAIARARCLRGRSAGFVDSITARALWLVAFTFGLMHGLGFAGGLTEAGLPAGHVPTGLLFFSVGVEAGHFLFVGVVLLLIALLRRVRISLPRWTELIPPYAIGSVAMFWVVQRLVAF
jgi:hypothetical protein